MTARDAALVTTAWLAERLSDPTIRVVEVDVDTTLYEKGHVPGAVAWNWTTQLNDPVRRDVATKEAFEALLSQSGIGPDTTIVLYGDHHNWFAAYAAWLLHYYGHDDVRLLDGGRRKWEAERRPLVDEVPQVAPTRYRVERVRSELRATRDDVLRPQDARLVDVRAPEGEDETKTTVFVDVRSPDEYSGKLLAPPGFSETAQRGGHVPGAVNVPWAKAVNDDGTYRADDELRALYADAVAGERVVTYCRIGERSAHTWFTLRRVLGLPDVRNYDGSWTEYGNLIGAPVALGPEP